MTPKQGVAAGLAATTLAGVLFAANLRRDGGVYNVADPAPIVVEHVHPRILDGYLEMERAARVPWTLPAAIGTLTSENGKFSPYDQIDRAPELPGIGRPSSNPSLPEAPTPGAPALPEPPRPRGNTVLVIGDSLCEPGLAQTAMREALQDRGLAARFDCRRGRTMVEAPDVLRGWLNRTDTGTWEVLVVALGTNDAVIADQQAVVERVTRTYRTIADLFLANSPIFWLDVSGRLPSRDVVNNTLAQLTSSPRPSEAPSVHVPWSGQVRASDLARDGIHLTGTGYRRRATFLADTVHARLQVGPGPISGPIWYRNPTGLDTAVWDGVNPPIGDRGKGEFLGPFLFDPALVEQYQVEPNLMTFDRRLDPRSDPPPGASAPEFLLWLLERYGEEAAARLGLPWPPVREDEAVEVWKEALAMLPIGNPDRLRACDPPRWQGNETSGQVSQMIRTAWRCLLTQAEQLYVYVGSDPVTLPRREAVEQVVAEAVTAAYLFSRWSPDPTDCVRTGPGDPAGVFPLTEEVFQRFVPDGLRALGRCHPVASTYAAAVAFLDVERLPLDQRDHPAGLYGRMAGGWARMPWVLGSGDRFFREGPALGWGWEPPEPCRAAFGSYLEDQLRSRETKVVLRDLPEPQDGFRYPEDQLDRLRDQVRAAFRVPTDRFPGTACASVRPVPTWVLDAVAGSVLRRVADERFRAEPGLRTGLVRAALVLRQHADRTFSSTPSEPPEPGREPILSRFAVRRLRLPAPPEVVAPPPETEFAERVVLLALLLGGLGDSGDNRELVDDPFESLRYRTAETSGTLPGVDPVIMAGYRNASARVVELAVAGEQCQVPVAAVAAVGWMESRHAANQRGPVPPNGDVKNPPIEDTSGGRAQGPMQFEPPTWRSQAIDGNNDGVADVHNIFDAALASARYLCIRAGGALTDDQRVLRAFQGYNGAPSPESPYPRRAFQKYQEYRVLLSITSLGPVDTSRCPTGPPPPGFVDGGTVANLLDLCEASLQEAASPAARGAITFSLHQVGKHYCTDTSERDGSGPNNCFDCSGLLWAAYTRGAGVNIGGAVWWTGSMIQHPNLQRLDRTAARAGDVWVIHAGAAQHTSMQLADGWKVHASGRNTGVRISRLEVSREYRFGSVFRVVPTG